MSGLLYIVGIGPGDSKQMTFAAYDAIADSDVIIGYGTYVDLLGGLISGKELVVTPMTREVDRAKTAVDMAIKGRKVAVISSGDAGVYGMAGLIYEILAESGWSGREPIVKVIPGVSALNSAASLLGAPLMHDFAVISLSDLLTPWSLILKRIEAASKADFIIVIYNPASKKRVNQLKECRQIVLESRGADVPVGIVTDGYRLDEKVIVTTLGDMLNHEISMTSTVIIGNSESFTLDNLIITPRGYQLGCASSCVSKGDVL